MEKSGCGQPHTRGRGDVVTVIAGAGGARRNGTRPAHFATRCHANRARSNHARRGVTSTTATGSFRDSAAPNPSATGPDAGCARASAKIHYFR